MTLSLIKLESGSSENAFSTGPQPWTSRCVPGESSFSRTLLRQCTENPSPWISPHPQYQHLDTLIIGPAFRKNPARSVQQEFPLPRMSPLSNGPPTDPLSCSTCICIWSGAWFLSHCNGVDTNGKQNNFLLTQSQGPGETVKGLGFPRLVSLKRVESKTPFSLRLCNICK